MGRFPGFEILAENLQCGLPWEYELLADHVNYGAIRGSTGNVLSHAHLGWLCDSIKEIITGLEHNIDDIDAVILPTMLQDLRDAFERASASNTPQRTTLSELLQKVQHLQAINNDWAHLETSYEEIDYTINGRVPEEGFWATGKAFENKADLSVSHEIPALNSVQHVQTVKMSLPQGGVLLLEQWRQELNGVVDEIAQATGESAHVKRQKAWPGAIYSLHHKLSAHSDYSHKVSSVFLTGPVYTGARTLATCRDHCLILAARFARKLDGGQLTRATLQYHYLVIESFVRAGAYEASVGEDLRQCMALFM